MDTSFLTVLLRCTSEIQMFITSILHHLWLVSDHSGGDQVVCGVHQDTAHCVWGLRTLSETTVPPTLQRPDQVRELCKHFITMRVSSACGGPGRMKTCSNCCRFFSSLSPLRPSRRQFPRVMPLSKPGENTHGILNQTTIGYSIDCANIWIPYHTYFR